MKLKKLLSLALLLCLLSTLFVGCLGKTEPVVIKDSDTFIVITADKDAPSLLEYMNSLKDKGELDFTIENGMLTSVNGIANPADFSSCWMVYTSYADYASEMFGTVEYGGKVYGSAVVGSETLPVKAGEIYIWFFASFS